MKRTQNNAGIPKEGQVNIVSWISVHDTIDGPKLRDLYKKLGCSKFEATGILVYLWQWGLNNADKDGLILHAEKYDIELFLQGEMYGCNLDSRDVVEALLETGWIDAEEDGLYLHDWSVWQKEWYKYKDRLSKDAARKREAYKHGQQENPSGTKVIPLAEEKKTEAKEKTADGKKNVKKPIDYTEEFVRFWTAYPRQDRKSEAFQCFRARIADGVPAEDMIRAAENYAARCRKEKTPTQYIRQAKTFLSTNLSFMDFLPVSDGNSKEDTGGNPFARYMEGG